MESPNSMLMSQNSQLNEVWKSFSQKKKKNPENQFSP